MLLKFFVCVESKICILFRTLENFKSSDEKSSKISEEAIEKRLETKFFAQIIVAGYPIPIPR